MYLTQKWGLPIVIEKWEGEVREHRDGSQDWPDAKYGYIVGLPGLDNEDLDVFIGPEYCSEFALAVVQLKGPEFDKIDELKVMLGYLDATSAIEAYHRFYPATYFGGCANLTVHDLRRFLYEDMEGYNLWVSDLTDLCSPSKLEDTSMENDDIKKALSPIDDNGLLRVAKSIVRPPAEPVRGGGYTVCKSHRITLEPGRECPKCQAHIEPAAFPKW